jgi:ribosomal protein S18 acetylase RimI-like enzyme
MNSIEFIRFRPIIGCAVLESLIKCYQNVFSGSPWNEWFVCSECKKYWGKNDISILREMEFRHCEKKLKLFWPRNKVRKDFIREVGESASCWIALKSNVVIGFCLGYQTHVQKLEEKLELVFEDELRSVFQVNEGQIAYQDDIGVLEEFRGLKIAKKLFLKRHDDFLKMGLATTVARTRELPEPSVTHEWFIRKMGYRIIKKYPMNDGRAILAQDLSLINES